MPHYFRIFSIYQNGICKPTWKKLHQSLWSFQMAQICRIFWFMPVHIQGNSNFSYNYILTTMICLSCNKFRLMYLFGLFQTLYGKVCKLYHELWFDCEQLCIHQFQDWFCLELFLLFHSLGLKLPMVHWKWSIVWPETKCMRFQLSKWLQMSKVLKITLSPNLSKHILAYFSNCMSIPGFNQPPWSSRYWGKSQWYKVTKGLISLANNSLITLL